MKSGSQQQLDLHVASPAEREQAYRNVHDVWSRGLPLEEHVRVRLASPKHQSATWYVGCIEGRVVVSLGAYPLVLGIDGEQLRGIAIGSVHTLAEYRGRGLASQLLRWVEQHAAAGGAECSLLYSDIAPAFYQRLGYVVCDGYEARCELTGRPIEGESSGTCATLDPAAGGAPDASPAATVTDDERHPGLTRFDPCQAQTAMARLFEACHGGRALYIARDAAYWEQLRLRGPEDRWYRLGSGDAGDGYVRVGIDHGRWQIRDYAVRPDREEELMRRLFTGLMHAAKREGAAAIEGWLPDRPEVRAWFRVVPRSMAITMVKRFDGRRLSEAARADAAYLVEIDHV